MKKTQMVSAGIAFVLAITFSLHAQTTTISIQSLRSASAADVETILAAIETTEPLPAESVPRYGLFYSARLPMGPPLPGPMGWPAWELASGVWLLDELDQPQGQMRAMAMDAPSLGEGGGDGGTNGSFTSNYTPPDYGTNLWLEITNIADGAVDLLLHNTQPEVPYELLSIKAIRLKYSHNAKTIVIIAQNKSNSVVMIIINSMRGGSSFCCISCI